MWLLRSPCRNLSEMSRVLWHCIKQKTDCITYSTGQGEEPMARACPPFPPTGHRKTGGEAAWVPGQGWKANPWWVTCEERTAEALKGQKSMTRTSQGEQLNLYRAGWKGCAGSPAKVNANLAYVHCRLSLPYITSHTTINILFSDQSSYSFIFPVHRVSEVLTVARHQAPLPGSQLPCSWGGRSSQR